jgi:hypothetical protein
VRVPERRLGLRARGTFAFALLAVVLSASMAVLTYQIARSYLLEQRRSLLLRQAVANARVVQSALRDPSTDLAEAIASLPLGSEAAALRGRTMVERVAEIRVDPFRHAVMQHVQPRPQAGQVPFAARSVSHAYVHAAFDRLWAGPSFTWAEIVAISDDAIARQPAA